MRLIAPVLCLVLAPAACGRVGFERIESGDSDHTADGRGSFGDDDGPLQVTVISPDGGELWAGGSAQSIIWSATDANGVAAASLALEYSGDGGGLWTSIASAEANDGVYTWVVPLIDSDQVLVRVSATDLANRAAVDTSAATFTIDSTPPNLASAQVTNANPTTVRTFGLVYGAVTGPYSDYCILVNSTAVVGCSWSAGTLPTSFRVDAAVEAKVLSIRLRDAAGNVSARVDTNAVSYAPSLSLTPPTFSGALVDTATVIAASHEFAVRLVADTGEVYLLGGYFCTTPDSSTTHSLSSVHAYDPLTEQWRSRAPMAERRAHFSGVELSDGRFWIGGGLRWDTGVYSYLKDTEIYDPVRDSWTKRRDMPADRYRFDAVRFTAADGKDRVAVIGGKQDVGTTVDTIYVYNPETDTWSDGPTMGVVRSDSVSVTLGDGRVFVGAGTDGTPLTSYGIYDPRAGTWSPGATNMANSHTRAAGFFVPAADTGWTYDAVVLFGGGVGSSLTPSNRVDHLRLDTGEWSSGAAMAASIGEGPVIAVGGDRFLRVGGVTGPTTASTSTVEEYDLSSNAWTAKAALPIARGWHSVTLLANDKVLVAGGVPVGYQETLPQNFLYTQGAPGSWAETGHFHLQTENYRAVKLADGRVLKCGGYSTLAGSVLRDCFRFDPATGNWDTVGKMGQARQDHMMVLLPNGDVLVAGGETDDSLTVTNTSEVYDAGTGLFAPTGSFANARRLAKLVLLQDGNTVLMAGGNDGHTTGGTYFRNAQKYAISGGTWSAAGTMNANRGNHAIALLNDGRVFVAGGFNGASTNSSCEIYDPSNDAWTPGPVAGAQHGAPLFAHAGAGANERVWVIGGFATNGGSATAVAEYYDVTTNAWVPRTSLPSSRWTMGQVLTADGMIYAFGGQLTSVNGGTPTTEVLRYSVATNSWTAITAVHGAQSAPLRYSADASAILLDDGRVLISGFGTAVRSTELYSFVTTQVFTAEGGDLNHSLSLAAGIGTFYPTTKLYVPQATDFSARGGPGSTATRVRLVDGEGLTDESDITVP